MDSSYDPEAWQAFAGAVAGASAALAGLLFEGTARPAATHDRAGRARHPAPVSEQLERPLHA